LNFHTVICPNCGNSLTVSERAPLKLTCPRCLASVENPRGGNAGVVPIPVLALEDQTSRDAAIARVMAGALAIVVTLGIVFLLQTLNIKAFNSGMIVLLIIVPGLAAYVLISVLLSRRVKTQPEVPVEPPQDPSSGLHVPSIVLQYHSPRRRGMSDDRFNILAAMAGFILALGTCAAGVFLLASTAGSHLGYLYVALIVAAIVLLCFVAAAFGDRRGFIGLRPGVIIGLVLGMMVLGPCGLCYLAEIK
jgi:ribosomal protein S27E